MKVTIEYDLPEESSELKRDMNAGEMICMLDELYNFLRTRWKYGYDENKIKTPEEAYEEIYEEFHELLQNYHISLFD